jgi:tetraacyldisaccharide 4'-kinase
MERDLKPGVFLLDDGFQHAQLARDVDIVLVDAQNPLAGGSFPLGRARESFDALARADAVVIARSSTAIPPKGIERLVQKHHPGVPMYRSRIVAVEWVDVEWGTSRPVGQTDARRVAAFCGLGSPTSFWNTLRELDLEIVFRWTFGDHHRYRPAEIRRIAEQAAAAGAEAIVTTEKDFVNLCPDAVKLAAPLRIYWLRIGIEIENEEQLLRQVL